MSGHGAPDLDLSTTPAGPLDFASGEYRLIAEAGLDAIVAPTRAMLDAFHDEHDLPREQDTADSHGRAATIRTKGRHDPCVGIRATPICEAMLALVLMDQALRHRAQCGDVGDVAPRIPG